MSSLAHVADEDGDEQRREVIRRRDAAALHRRQVETFLQRRKTDENEAEHRHSLHQRYQT